MRFFKSFPGFTFHRRSKSDSSIPKPTPARDHILRPQSLDAAQAALLAAAVPSCPQTFLFPTPADASNAIFELETANSRLRNDLSALAGECVQLRSQLDTTRADLFTQLHRTSLVARQAQAGKMEVEALQAKLVQYERFLGLMINVGLHQRVLGDAHSSLRAGIDPDMALVDAIKEAAAIPGSAWSTIIPSVTGPRTPNEYRSSLNLTLKTRKELRDTKKIARFWKRIAQEEGRTGIVTPSVSTISSIHEPLPAERQKAVEELMASRRRASLTSQVVAREDTAISASASTSSASTSTDISIMDITTSDIPPSHSESELPCLSPLASESFKSELASRSSNRRLFKRGPSSASKQTRTPLGQIDMNVTSNLSQNSGQQRNKTSVKRRVDLRAENNPQVPKVLNASSDVQPRARELSAPNVVPSFSKHSICSNRLGPLGRIEEEHEDFVTVESLDDLDGENISQEAALADPDAGNISQESNWSMLDFPDQDLSLSFYDMTTSTAPTTPEKAENDAEIATPTKTSRLPKPVLKQLNRMSLNKPGKKTEAPQLTTLAIRKKSAGGHSTTRLPLAVQGNRNVWRT